MVLKWVKIDSFMSLKLHINSFLYSSFTTLSFQTDRKAFNIRSEPVYFECFLIEMIELLKL